MRTLLLAAVAALAAPAPAQFPPYDVRSITNATVIDWNGQPALLMWGRMWDHVCSFHGEGAYTRVAFDVQFAMFADDRPCAVGASVGIDFMAIGHVPFGRMPPGGILFSTTPYEMCDRSARNRNPDTTYAVDYCPSPSWCDGCNLGSHDRPQLWAIIATVRLR